MFGLRFQTLNRNKKSMTQAFSSYSLSCNLCLTYLKAKLQQDRCRWWDYKVKCHKTAKTTYLEANKQQTRYRLSYLEVSKLEKGYGWCFEMQTTAWKLIETFSEVINKQVRCASCIYSVKCKRTGMFDVFTSPNATKRYKENI